MGSRGYQPTCQSPHDPPSREGSKKHRVGIVLVLPPLLNSPILLLIHYAARSVKLYYTLSIGECMTKGIVPF